MDFYVFVIGNPVAFVLFVSFCGFVLPVGMWRFGRLVARLREKGERYDSKRR